MVKAPVDHLYPSLYRDSHNFFLNFFLVSSFFCLFILLLSMFNPKSYVVL